MNGVHQIRLLSPPHESQVEWLNVMSMEILEKKKCAQNRSLRGHNLQGHNFKLLKSFQNPLHNAHKHDLYISIPYVIAMGLTWFYILLKCHTCSSFIYQTCNLWVPFVYFFRLVIHTWGLHTFIDVVIGDFTRYYHILPRSTIQELF